MRILLDLLCGMRNHYVLSSRLLACGLLLALLSYGCARQTLPMTNISLPLPDITQVSRLLPGSSETDLSSQPWNEAFEQLHHRMAREYPFTAWKQIDWETKYAHFAPQIEAATAQEDSQAYYLALRKYLYSISDGQVQISAEPEYRKEAIGGGYGFAVTAIDNGRIITHVLDEEGPAAHAGMVWGAELLEWNGLPIQEAIEQTPTLWSDIPPANHESQARVRQRMLTRDPVGEQATITFQNPNATAPTTVSLYAIDDEYSILEQTKLHRQDFNEFESSINYRILPSGYCYIQVKFIAPTMTMPFPMRAFRSAIDRFVKEDAPGLILDLRGNIGGTFTYVPAYAGHFYEGHRFYEDVAYYQSSSDSFEIDPESRLEIEPRDPYYDGEVVVLVNEATVGSGEGLPLALKDLPDAHIMGINGTHGSFGVPGRNISLPNDISVWYPLGQSLDEAGNIQVDANAAGKGGVQPDIRLPLNADTLHSIFQEDEDYELESAVRWLDERLDIERDDPDTADRSEGPSEE